MAKYKVSVEWQGSNEVEDDFESEEDAIAYGYECLADGCGEVIVNVELIEDDDEIDEDNNDEEDL